MSNRLIAEFRREVQDKLAVVYHGANNPLRSPREVVQKQCEDFLVEQFESALEQSKAERAALAVLVTTPHIVNYLTWHDPKALEQARTALGTCNDCGQGPAFTKAYEHKSTCQWWRTDED